MADDELFFWQGTIMDIQLQHVSVHQHNCLGKNNAVMGIDSGQLRHAKYAAIASAKPARIEQDNYTVNSLHDLSPRITFSKTAAWNSSGRRDILVF